MHGMDLRKLSIRNRKRAFIYILLPSINVVNLEIKRDIAIIDQLSKKNRYTPEEKRELYRIFKTYNVSLYNWKELKSKMIIYPTSLILSQGALESGWGTSKLFRVNNNLFGIKAGRQYKSYDSIKDSVKDFILTLSRVDAYKTLRKKVNNGESPKSIAHGLTRYSVLGKTYVKKVHTMIDHNGFERYDKKTR